ncbi:MAG: methyltransferase domain-containing protein [Deltaproteobacteria bacterium]|nr:methyltransferase domain-containing protein [Deltaproteobacteria bacterium]
MAAPKTYSSREIQALYRTHLLREEAILKRILDHRGSLAGITEMDLAEDPVSEITDQNHIGGVKFVKDLARKAGIGPATEILDVGCGLGGSARCLAHLFGCRVHGVDLSKQRCSEALDLTKLVGLEDLVTFQHGDVLKIALPTRRFDVVWAQSAWVHIENKEKLIKKCRKSLKAEGRIALEEPCLKRLPRNQRENRELRDLADHWKSYLEGLDVWTELLSSQSFEVYCKTDLSPELGKLYRKLIRLARGGVITHVSRSEQKAWELGLRLVAKGIVGYFRLVARKLPQGDFSLRAMRA